MNSNPDFPFGTYRNQCLLSRYLPHVQGAVDRGRIDLPILYMRISNYPKPQLCLENHEKWSYSRSDWISEVRMGGLLPSCFGFFSASRTTFPSCPEGAGLFALVNEQDCNLFRIVRCRKPDWHASIRSCLYDVDSKGFRSEPPHSRMVADPGCDVAGLT